MLFSTRRTQIVSVLRERFSLSALRPGQMQAVECLLSGRDLLCIFPTGAGKSLCYQLPATMLPGCTLVVSPLIALMNDQVRGLGKKGIAAACVNSLQSEEDRMSVLRAYQRGELKLLYVAPERLRTPAFEQLLKAHPPCMLVVDEAHCVVEWGEEFRPSYRDIASFVAGLPKRPVLCAMTATADRKMQRQIVRDLGMRRPKRMTQPFVRSNLRYQTLLTPRKEAWITQYFNSREPCKGIVFCRTRVRTERLAATLGRTVGECGCYHAGLDRETRKRVQEDFTAGRLRVLCATSAFGMGIDVQDVRVVIHDELPEDLRALAQQSGRAGRDGKPADCIVLIDPANLEYRRKVLQRNIRRCRGVERWLMWYREWSGLSPLLRWCFGGECLSAGLSRAFGQRAGSCGVCSVCARKKRGERAKLADVPRLDRMRPDALRLWALTALRRQAAQTGGKAERRLAPNHVLYRASQTGVLPDKGIDPALRAVMRETLGRMFRMGADG